MHMQFHQAESRARLASVEDTDIVLRLDDAGFVMHASPGAAALGIDLTSLLLMPHICDFAETEYASRIAELFASARSGERPQKWIDFPLVTPGGGAQDDHGRDPDAESGSDAPRWYAIWLEPVEEDDGAGQGCIANLRCRQSQYAMADEIEALSATDPLTGLDNRAAFCASLARLLAREGDGPMPASAGARNAVAIFAIDRMRAIFMQYGQATADEIRWGFAKYLETMTHADQSLALLDEERFAVLLPGMTMRAAREWAHDVLRTFAGLTAGSSSKDAELTASAGLARAENSVDWILRQAEMGLVMARAGGGGKAGTCKPAPRIADGARIEQAIQAALVRAEQRAV